MGRRPYEMLMGKGLLIYRLRPPLPVSRPSFRMSDGEHQDKLIADFKMNDVGEPFDFEKSVLTR